MAKKKKVKEKPTEQDIKDAQKLARKTSKMAYDLFEAKKK